MAGIIRPASGHYTKCVRLLPLGGGGGVWVSFLSFFWGGLVGLWGFSVAPRTRGSFAAKAADGCFREPLRSKSGVVRRL